MRENILHTFLLASLSFVIDRFRSIGTLLIVLIFLMAIDFVSGIMAAGNEKIDNPEDPNVGIKSSKGAKGIQKKIAILLVIVIGMTIDYVIFKYAAEMNLNVPINTFFGILATLWYAVNEMISILENCVRIGIEVPDWLFGITQLLSVQINKKGNTITEETTPKD